MDRIERAELLVFGLDTQNVGLGTHHAAGAGLNRRPTPGPAAVCASR